jgi:predicted HAD superfamily Cof-like phosphohydrolase
MKMLDDVYGFMEAFDQIQNKEQLQDLYLKLIQEEYRELFEAVETKNEVEEFDACIDLIWVILGHMIVKGWNVPGGWNEVTRSNMSKLDPTTGKAIHREDGKVIKPPTWSPPNLTPHLNIKEI